jgi:hypothetical protein
VVGVKDVYPLSCPKGKRRFVKRLFGQDIAGSKKSHKLAFHQVQGCVVRGSAAQKGEISERLVGANTCRECRSCPPEGPRNGRQRSWPGPATAPGG